MADSSDDDHQQDIKPKKQKISTKINKKNELVGERDLSGVKNKILRTELYQKQKMEKNKEKRKLKERRKRDREEGGEDVGPPKQVQKTLDNLRVKDETMIEPDDEEVMQDAYTDEYANYFSGGTVPKILFTTCNRPRNHETMKFIKDMLIVFPNSTYKNRKGIDLKKIIPQAIEHGFTDLVVINEDQKNANGIVISHLPDGPTAHFKLTSIRKIKNIKNHGRTSSHKPEVILNNFNTRLGHSVGRCLAALLPYDPDFEGRRVITFHNQRDFIFFRHHRYIFKNEKKTGLQELGPRFTLKLRSLQKGTFNSKFGEYEWIHKRKEMDSSRRKFHL